MFPLIGMWYEWDLRIIRWCWIKCRKKKKRCMYLQKPLGQQPLQCDNWITNAPFPFGFVEGIFRKITPPPPLFKLSSPIGVSVMNMPRDKFPQQFFDIWEALSSVWPSPRPVFAKRAPDIEPWPKTMFFACIRCLSHWIASKWSVSSLLTKKISVIGLFKQYTPPNTAQSL